MEEKVKLEGFNNISKSIFISFYRFCYASGGGAQIEQCLNWLNDSYLANGLSEMISLVAKEVGAQILSSSKQDYEPIGASAVALLAEPSGSFPVVANTASAEKLKSHSQLCHLDKSHIAVHTYPEANRQTGVCTFRVDFDLSTCGVVSPLSSLTRCIRFFNSDLVVIDYRQRGFTRELTGSRRYRDSQPETMMDILDRELLKEFSLKETKLFSHRLHLASLKRRDFDKGDFTSNHENLGRYFYGKNLDALDDKKRREGLGLIKREVNAVEQEI